MLLRTFTYNYLGGCGFISHGCRIREITGSYGNSVHFFKEVMDCFPKQLYYFTFRSAKHSGSSFPTSLSTFAIFCGFFFLILNFVKVFQVSVKCFTLWFWCAFPITLWQIEGGNVEAVTDFIFLGSKITVDLTEDMKLKTFGPWKVSYGKPR